MLELFTLGSCRVAVALAVVIVGPFGLGFEPPSSQDFAANWHQWRGPNANGSASETATPPVSWDKSKNIQWATDLPGEGSATPAIWGNQVFVLSAKKTDRKAEVPIVPHDTAKTIPPNVYYQFNVTSIETYFCLRLLLKMWLK